MNKKLVKLYKVLVDNDYLTIKLLSDQDISRENIYEGCGGHSPPYNQT